MEPWRPDVRVADWCVPLYGGGRQEHAGGHLQAHPQRGAAHARLSRRHRQGLHTQTAHQGSQKEIG